MARMRTDRSGRGGLVRVLVFASAVGAGCVTVGLSGGCQRSLFSDETDRTPFDRYDRIQNQYAVPFVYDEYGTRVPNLRARLLPRD